MGPRTLGGATGSLSYMYANARDFRQGEGTGTRMARSATRQPVWQLIHQIWKVETTNLEITCTTNSFLVTYTINLEISTTNLAVRVN